MKGGEWQRPYPTPRIPGSGIKSPLFHAEMAFHTQVKAMHHWIRKGDAERAAKMAKVVVHQAGKILAQER